MKKILRWVFDEEVLWDSIPRTLFTLAIGSGIFTAILSVFGTLGIGTLEPAHQVIFFFLAWSTSWALVFALLVIAYMITRLKQSFLKKKK